MITKGLILHKDPNDTNYGYHSVTGDRPPFKQKEWWADGYWGDQGDTPYCGAYSWLHIFEDGPVFQDNLIPKRSPLFSAKQFYNKCKEIDGLDNEGTTIHTGAKIAKSLGLISEYRWADNVEDAIHALLVHGPVVAGTYWYAGMEADEKGRMSLTGASMGGHAYVINGVDVDRKTFRIKNSYGKKWGKRGHGFLSFTDMQQLFDDGGLICVPFINKVTHLDL